MTPGTVAKGLGILFKSASIIVSQRERLRRISEKVGTFVQGECGPIRYTVAFEGAQSEVERSSGDRH